jgi:hypothetical protein
LRWRGDNGDIASASKLRDRGDEVANIFDEIVMAERVGTPRMSFR